MVKRPWSRVGVVLPLRIGRARARIVGEEHILSLDDIDRDLIGLIVLGFMVVNDDRATAGLIGRCSLRRPSRLRH
jgi:hypothetical protein